MLTFRVALCEMPLLIVKIRGAPPNLSLTGVTLTLHPEPEEVGADVVTNSFELMVI